MGRELSRIVRDLPIELDLEAARLGDYDRDTVVRLFREYEFRTLIERLPPMAGESRQRAVREPPVGRRERLRAGGARRRAARDGWGAAAARRAPRAASSSSASTSTSVTAPAPAPTTRGAAAAGDDRRRRPPSSIEPAGDLPTALAAAIVDPGRIEVRGADRIDDLARVARRPARRRGVARSPTTRDRAAARRSRSPSPAPDGRVVAADGAEAADALRHLVEALGAAARRARGQAGPRRPVRRGRPTRTGDAGRVRHADRRVHPQRRAAQPDDRRRRRREPRPDPAAGDGAAGDRPGRARGAVGARRPRAARAPPRRQRSSTACSARSSCR